jgi:hypothetical protein
MQTDTRERIARNLVNSAISTWPEWRPCLNGRGKAVAWPDGPEITIELVAGHAYGQPVTLGVRPGGGYVPPVEAVRDAVAVLRGIAQTSGNDETPRGAGGSSASSTTPTR